MLGAIVRAVVTFIGGMLIASILAAVMGKFVSASIKPELGTDSILYVALNATTEQFIVVLVIAVLVGVLVRSVVESRLGGGV